MNEPVSFLESWFVWRDAIIVAALCALALSYLGVWVVLKAVVYVPLALAQVSSAGVVLSFWVCSVCGFHGHTDLFDPAWAALVFAIGAALHLARPSQRNDSATAVAYLVGAATTLLVAGFVRQDLHDVESVLFGSAVLVETRQILHVAIAAALVGLLHLLFYRRFLFVSFDADAAGAAAIAVYRHEALLYVSFAVMISVATRAIGALPAFGFAVLPALAGLALAKSMGQAFAVAAGVGLFSAVGGYLSSFFFELPAGATMVAVAALIAVAFSTRRSRAC